MRKSALLAAAVLALVPATAQATAPSISVSNTPQCAGFTFTATLDSDQPGTWKVTAQHYDSETVTPVGDPIEFTGEVAWGEATSVAIDPATDYLLWTYRVDSSLDGKGLTTYGERQLDCRPSEPVDPEPEPEEPIEEPSEPIEEPSEPSEDPAGPIDPDPVLPDAPGGQDDAPDTTPTDSDSGDEAPQAPETDSVPARAVLAEPRTAG